VACHSESGSGTEHGSAGTVGESGGAGGGNATGGSGPGAGGWSTSGTGGLSSLGIGGMPTVGSGGLGVGGVVVGLGGSGSGGAPGTGGAGTGGSGVGGAAGTGGSVATGGAVGTGGVVATGGAVGTGGFVATGGAAGTGGFVATGGAAGGAAGAGAGGDATGGSSGSGGADTGGASGNGGAGGDATGGAPPILGATPPMGWNSWNTFACDGLNETVVRETADAFISTGMADAGYEYVNLDDCWMDGRDPATNRLRWDTTRFPSGIPALADYIHGLDLKIGIYETPNTLTCSGLYGGFTQGVGSLGYEEIDAQTFAEWGIDYLKYDKCQGPMDAFAVMRDALRATGRPIFYSINPADQGPFCTPTNCPNRPDPNFDLTQIANMWRIEMDIWDSWNEVLRLIDANKDEYIGAGPGHWNDPDMLEVGNPGLSDTESRAHFSMWVIMAAPLIAGNDVTRMSATTIETLTNPEVVAVNQDPLGYQGRVVATPGADLEVWSKELSGTNTRAVALLNRGPGSASITVQWSDLGIPAGAATVRDLWARQDLGTFTDSYTANDVQSHSVVMLEVVSAP
jgi:alpha-galactosidase